MFYMSKSCVRLQFLRHYCVQVYDVTKFLDDHPGGDEVLLTSTGNMTIF